MYYLNRIRDSIEYAIPNVQDAETIKLLNASLEAIDNCVACGWWVKEDIQEYEDYEGIRLTDADVERIGFSLGEDVLNNHETISIQVQHYISLILEERKKEND